MTPGTIILAYPAAAITGPAPALAMAQSAHATPFVVILGVTVVVVLLVVLFVLRRKRPGRLPAYLQLSSDRCQRCNTPVRRMAKFCHRCGLALPAPATPQPLPSQRPSRPKRPRQRQVEQVPPPPSAVAQTAPPPAPATKKDNSGCGCFLVLVAIGLAIYIHNNGVPWKSGSSSTIGKAAPSQFVWKRIPPRPRGAFIPPPPPLGIATLPSIESVYAEPDILRDGARGMNLRARVQPGTYPNLLLVAYVLDGRGDTLRTSVSKFAASDGTVAVAIPLAPRPTNLKPGLTPPTQSLTGFLPYAALQSRYRTTDLILQTSLFDERETEIIRGPTFRIGIWP